MSAIVTRLSRKIEKRSGGGRKIHLVKPQTGKTTTQVLVSMSCQAAIGVTFENIAIPGSSALCSGLECTKQRMSESRTV